jgi:hypothetical protein
VLKATRRICLLFLANPVTKLKRQSLKQDLANNYQDTTVLGQSNIKGADFMIKLIIGKKGSGKTKKLVDLVNEATSKSLGNVVCIEKGDTLTFSVTHKARLIDADAFGISGYGEYYGMLSGIKAGNHDVTHIFGDATLRAAKEAGLKVKASAPSPIAPSMVKALDIYCNQVAEGVDIADAEVKDNPDKEEFIRAQQSKLQKKTRTRAPKKSI